MINSKIYLILTRGAARRGVDEAAPTDFFRRRAARRGVWWGRS